MPTATGKKTDYWKYAVRYILSIHLAFEPQKTQYFNLKVMGLFRSCFGITLRAIENCTYLKKHLPKSFGLIHFENWLRQ